MDGNPMLPVIAEVSIVIVNDGCSNTWGVKSRVKSKGLFVFLAPWQHGLWPVLRARAVGVRLKLPQQRVGTWREPDATRRVPSTSRFFASHLKSTRHRPHHNQASPIRSLLFNFYASLCLHINCTEQLCSPGKMMEKSKSSPAARTPAKTPATAKTAKQAPSTGKQRSILGFFSRTGAAGATNGATASPSPSTKPASSSKRDSSPQCLKETTTKANSMLVTRRTTTATPVPSSDAAEPLSSQENRDASTVKVASMHVLSSPAHAKIAQKSTISVEASLNSSPSRKASRCTAGITDNAVR